MRVSAVMMVAAVAVGLAATPTAGLAAPRVALADLERAGPAEGLVDALRRSGVVQVAEVPGLAEARAEALALGVACSAASEAAHTAVLGDGTHRRSLGTVPGEGFAHGADAGAACRRFDEASAALREATSRAARAFAAKLSDNLPRASFLATLEDEAAYETVEEIVRDSQQLEHFHSYNRAEAAREEAGDTVDMHLDQGLFIAFTPALMYHARDAKVMAAKPGTFLVGMPDGIAEEIEFADNGDVIVFMLGDGVNQIINPILARMGHPELRAAPHAMQMPVEGPGADAHAWRSWYGRMYLPPAEAINDDFGLPYGVMREHAIDASLKGDAQGMAMGCSGDLFARELAGESCAANQVYCWHRCLNYTAEASPEVCESEGSEVACAAPNGQLWTHSSGHGMQFQPRCTNRTDYYTMSPTVAPTDEPSPASAIALPHGLVTFVLALLLAALF